MKQVSAQEAYDLMQQDPEYVYLDVRSVPEFERGHPVRAVNIPLMHFTPGLGMTPNDDFLIVVESTVPRDSKVLIGCQTGTRSAHACEMLSRLGYENVANIRGGYLGVMDGMGRVVEPGWSLLKLPDCRNCNDGDRYDALAAKVKK